ncbi:hypothetical protein DFJ58DRAFT_749711 [Suillus subalutaceus]|uniref:uncharacterized protein n=1 Tax=Suillus subalutaceus TaxID=48586 RepID=UPI001B879C3C|nr:uncharacterized protein DFJ58DRAFT_749711 [Suillus subalutaceus]KAG1836743.1 hypothetical protein DFJ58DRAFT_749711 [Suillus subalutaceus]
MLRIFFSLNQTTNDAELTEGFAYGLLSVLNAHFRTVFGITKLQSAFLQLAYFGTHSVWAPFAGVIIGRIGYNVTSDSICASTLALYSIGLQASGAIFCWPSTKFEPYGGFVGSIFATGYGLWTLEVAANSCITALGTPQNDAAARLKFSHELRAVITFVRSLIASRWFITGANATSFGTV